ncbi:phosphonate C-P lyase system protein PhnH [Paenalcaligenes sp. Me131]|uniref:phosphonate C-P lyase system protein PhnH n=1 Tax=Paenalcaligenes sp. Me131 TaxID=3392636 RepID=UPI003D280E17
MTQPSLQAAFSNPVHQAQQCFRHIAQALAEPGLVEHIALVGSMDALDAASHASALTLLDSDTPIWISPALDSAALRRHLIFHCACPIVEQPEDAQFVFMSANDTAVLSRLDAGTDRDPEFSCTVFLQVASLQSGTTTTWSGPGIQHSRNVQLPMSPEFWQQRDAITAFPRGVDICFVAGQDMMGLPRSTRVGLQTKE